MFKSEQSKFGRILLRISYPHVDSIIWLHPAVGAQRVLDVLHLMGARRENITNSLVLDTLAPLMRLNTCFLSFHSLTPRRWKKMLHNTHDHLTPERR